jgi:hypothetical protein
VDLGALFNAKVAASNALVNAVNNVSTTRTAAEQARQTYFTTQNQANLNAWNNAEANFSGALQAWSTAEANYLAAQNAFDQALLNFVVGLMPPVGK